MGTPFCKPFHPYKKVAEDALSRGIIDTVHTSGGGTDIRLAAIVRKQTAQYAHYKQNHKQVSHPRPQSCHEEPIAGNDVPASMEVDSTHIQQTTYEEVPVDATIPDGSMPSPGAIPEWTSVMRQPLPWPAGFFGGILKRLMGDLPTNSAVAHAGQCGQHDKILARKQRREDKDDDSHIIVTEKVNQEQGGTPKEYQEKLQARKRRRDMEQEKSTCTGKANFTDGLQQDRYASEETSQMGDAGHSRDKSMCNAADPEQGEDSAEAAYPEARYSSGTNEARHVGHSRDKSTCNAVDPEQGEDSEEAAYSSDTDEARHVGHSRDKSMCDTVDPKQGDNGEEAAYPKAGYSSSTNKSMYDTEGPGEDINQEEESSEEFEDLFYTQASEEQGSDDEESNWHSIKDCQVGEPSVVKGKKGESEQSEAVDIKGKKKGIDPIGLQQLQETLESQIRQNMQKELAQIVESAVADAIAKAFSNGLIQSSTPNSTAVPENSLPLARHCQKKVKQLPWLQPSEYNAFKKSIRELRQKLLGLESSEELPQSISEEEVTAWDFRNVFAMEYLKRYKGENYMLEYVVEAWLTRVAGMKAQYKCSQQDKATHKDRKVLHQQRQRKQELYKRHLDIAYQYAEIKDQAVHVVQSLSLDGMSSNESDHEGHSGEAMTSSLKESARLAVKELPSDFYSHNWYQAQNDFMKGQLKVMKQPISLEIPAEYLNSSSCPTKKKRGGMGVAKQQTTTYDPKNVQ
ncbi:hypothetical protein BKA82DRAFT_9423 [Pisolithus tinctorius]|uniref:Uncharacterized protein n=1 Tax=Pisolithus tinctorius Marx 270 TaxID=870435 RepID=A0A0C3NSH6_PISTI|nr:hypothetical protein BKA82DRAFT_9423 [Pisolithus tinctorius]KIO03790.1 hypothetical protein M404DRAFT_9423 [Pisolithus tinctorius Marx 270]